MQCNPLDLIFFLTYLLDMKSQAQEEPAMANSPIQLHNEAGARSGSKMKNQKYLV